MIPKADFHVHTSFCDGKNTAEEMVLAALDKGMQAIGFSGHCHTDFDESWCMSPSGTAAYQAEISRLKDLYGTRIEIYCGVEQDYYSNAPTAGYDYVIGSVHYLLADGVYIPVDESEEILLRAAERHFHGDIYALCEAYFQTVAEVCERTNCDIIGHFDLINKFNEDGRLFDPRDPRFVRSWQAAADRLLGSAKPFEINTGAIARAYRTRPYPADEMIDYIRSKGGSFVMSGDAHSTEGLCWQFD